MQGGGCLFFLSSSARGCFMRRIVSGSHVDAKHVVGLSLGLGPTSAQCRCVSASNDLLGLIVLPEDTFRHPWMRSLSLRLQPLHSQWSSGRKLIDGQTVFQIREMNFNWTRGSRRLFHKGRSVLQDNLFRLVFDR